MRSTSALVKVATLLVVACGAGSSSSDGGDVTLPGRDVCTADVSVAGDVAPGSTIVVTATAVDSREVSVTTFEASFVEGGTTFAATNVDAKVASASIVVPGAVTPGKADLHVHRVTKLDNGGTRTLDLCTSVDVVAPFASLAITSAATSLQPDIAPDSIAAARGDALATGTASATSTPLPGSLLGAHVVLRADGVDHAATIFSVAPGEIVFLVPADVALARTTVTVTHDPGSGGTARGDVTVAKVAPAIFTAGRTPTGPPAAYLQRDVSGTLTTEDVAKQGTSGEWTPLPLDVTNGTVTLVLTTTGLRARSSLAGVIAQVGGTNAPVLYAGPYPSFAGADQLNVQLPAALAGRGAVTLGLAVDSVPSNLVDLVIK